MAAKIDTTQKILPIAPGRDVVLGVVTSTTVERPTEATERPQ
jgi:hypothetical protein